MKLLIIILTMILPLKTKANEKMYTDYILTEQNVETYKQETDYIKREEITLYNTYTLEKIDEGYQIPNETNKHLIKDEQDYITDTYYTETKVDEDQVQYSYIKTLKNYEVYEIYFRHIPTYETLDDKIEYIKIYDKDTLILEISQIEPSKKSIAYFIPKTNILNLRIETKYKDDANNKQFDGYILFNGSNLSVASSFRLKKTQKNNIVIQQYLLEEDFNKLSEQITWKHDTEWHYPNLVGYKKTDTKYHYYSYKKTYLNKYTNAISDEYNIDYKDSKTYYNYYTRYYYVLSDKIDIKNINNIILDTNANKDNINITYKENDNNYLVEIEYLNTKVYKLYQKETTKQNKSVTTKSSSIKVVNLSSNIQTTKKIEQQQTKENTKINYTYMIILLPLTLLLYTIYNHKKK